MRGYVMLTEGRSGSSWLGDLANSMGSMGNASEWLSENIIGARMKSMPAADFGSLAIERATTPNERFGIKIFPRHMIAFQDNYGEDFLDFCASRCELTVIRLYRRDVVRHAVSLLRARQTSQWRSDTKAIRSANYDFIELARCYFYIEESNSFWRSYLNLRPFQHQSFAYEDLIENPSEFTNFLADRLAVQRSQHTSAFAIQRDSITEDWAARFTEDLKSLSPLAGYDRRKPIDRRLRNFWQLARKKLKGRPPFAFT